MTRVEDQGAELRLDKWLWVARFYKSRAIARAMIEGGKVHYNGQRSKPGKQVEVGALVRLWQGDDEKEVQVLQLAPQRRGASEAQLLYRETEQSELKRQKMAETRRLNSLYAPHPDSRPDKKQRRDLMRLKLGNTES
ncbi:MAG: ribosome-associated heat shock protein Hsp15 [Aeromonadaceae bacterium]|nr:ribosome-associated heat shock protein Hsp15 [Aeromonadaceae bacterium]